MQFQYSFKHMDVSPALKDYASGKISQMIQKFVTKPIEIHLTFSVENNIHKAHCALNGGDGFSIQVDHGCSDMYGSVDRMLDKLSVQLKRKKDKLKAHKGNRGFRNLRYRDPDKIDYNNAEIDASDIVAYERAVGRLKAG